MKLKQDVIMRKVAGEYIFVPVKTSDDSYEGIITADETGAFIIDKLEQGISKEDLLKAICSEFDVEEDIAKADVEEILESLVKKGLLD